ncbi:hypothetical protein OSTOST_03715 [Ostertagia ostertagi]
MKKKRILKGLLLLALCSMSRQGIYAQELYLNPTQTVYELATSIPTYNCPVFDVNGMRKEDSINMVNRVTPTRFAKKFELNITPRNAGIWEDVGDVKVWRYKITSNDAYSMMVMFKDLKLPEDASLFVYNEDLSYISGPFTAGYNANNVLATELIPGGSIIVEMVCDARYTRDAYFNIASVSHDYWNVIGVISGNVQDAFNLNINSPADDQYTVSLTDVTGKVLLSENRWLYSDGCTAAGHIGNIGPTTTAAITQLCTTIYQDADRGILYKAERHCNQPRRMICLIGGRILIQGNNWPQHNRAAGCPAHKRVYIICCHCPRFKIGIG